MIFERRLAAWMIWSMAAFLLVVALHWWQEALGEDSAWIWSCSTMGNELCGPNEPLVKIQIGGAD